MKSACVGVLSNIFIKFGIGDFFENCGEKYRFV